ncbi:MAG TPA: peptidylprolyl isomerase, partial [Polyangiaceae bacterium]|nr:peptidylprolyl isomerase [Polyangiaceae bacterium]
AGFITVTAAGCADGCQNSDPAAGAPSSSASAAAPSPAVALSPELRGKVLARVGTREITLGEYAATLERMNEFERLRYQSPERRKLLLEEMIQVELLAEEARRRGLDKQPETQARLRQILRDEVLRDARRALPKPEEIPVSEVRAYYAKHQAEFQEPERRRVAHLQVLNEREAGELLQKARAASPKEWGQLVRAHSVDRGRSIAIGDPDEFAGDLGIVAKPGVEGGENPKVPEPVRAAVFDIAKIGEVHPELVRVGDSFHIVRLIGKTDARARSVQEAERSIRVRLLEERAKQLERDLERELRAKYPVVLDEQQLAKLRVPKRAP